jgi:hypothetical protein
VYTHPCFLDIGITYRRVVSFTLRPSRPCGNRLHEQFASGEIYGLVEQPLPSSQFVNVLTLIPLHGGSQTVCRCEPSTQYIHLREPSTSGGQGKQFCTLLQVPTRLHGDSRDLHSFSASLHVRWPIRYVWPVETTLLNGPVGLTDLRYTHSLFQYMLLYLLGYDAVWLAQVN